MDRSSFSGKITGILLRRNAISQEVLQKALDDSQNNGKRLEEFLVENKLVSETDMTLAISEYLGWPPISLARFTPNPLLIELVPRDVLKKSLTLPIAKTGKMLTMALGDPFNMAILDELQTLTGHEIVPLVAFEKEVKDLLQRFAEAPSHDLEDILKDVTDSDEIEVGHQKEEEVSLDQMLESAEGAPVIRLVNSMLVEAMRRRASDIHIEPMERSLRLRYRIDGDLYEFPNPPKNLQSAIISRIKIMSDMNIAERRIPQDGRFKIKALGKEVDVRVNLLPLIHGEKIVMRILDKSNLAPSLNALGLDPKAYDSLIYAIAQPNGVILVTGP
ncbi:MAG: Flp pilus assembly complex ATPase component TadA, partial [Lentisphaerae bacterium]|nr:Flp pilus assembly complex ATPase component TadA [Lentisphaerota bacterium]